MKMPQSWWTRVGAFAAATVVALLLLVPTAFDSQYGDLPEEQQPGWFRAVNSLVGGARITWGLDLVGGLHLQYQVDVDKAISDRLDRYAAQIRDGIVESHPDAAGVQVERIGDEHALLITSEAVDPTTLIDNDRLFDMRLIQAGNSATTLRLDLDSEFVEQTRQYAIAQAIETIRKRIDASGVVEPSITRRGESDIIVQLPGLQESQFEQIKSVIGQTAQLHFQMVSLQNAAFIASMNLPAGDGIVLDGPVPTSADPVLLQSLLDGVETPPGTELRVSQRETYDRARQQVVADTYVPMLVETGSELTGEYITGALVTADPNTGRPVVSMSFDEEGTRMFARLTAENVNRQMAIVLDGVSRSAPNINEPIPNGRAQISMGGGGSIDQTMAEAEALSIVLRNGALPAPIEKQFETQVGPSLGADSVRAGGLSLIISFVLVALFMAYWYKVAGLFSVLALAMNVTFIAAGLALLNATLTLPGIAGITLTIGMAVDANVVIYERIKEELRLGVSVTKALSAAYDKATTAVLDSNITTAIAGLVLMEVGSGPIRGFAVTLLLGIATSLITAIFVTRLGFDFLTIGRRADRLSI